MTNEEKKLLAFFAANARADEVSRFQQYTVYEEIKKRVNLCGGIYYGEPQYSLEELKFLFAQSMLEKYKEFCSL